MDVGQLVTGEQLEQMGERDYDFELVRGKLVPMTPAGREHGAVAMLLRARLAVFTEERGLGRVYAAETGFILRRDPDTVRAPDVGFVCRDREVTMQSWRGFINGPPDLAVEVRSPDDSLPELTRKAADYLEAGSRLAWIVDPLSRSVHVHRPHQAVLVLSGDAALEGGDLLPGFTLPVSRIFAELE